MKILLLLTVIISVLLLSCSTEPSREPFLFVVQVDSIVHPSSVLLNDTITIKFFGTIGYDGCHAFSYFDAAQQPQQIDIAVIGERSSSSVCPAVVVSLDGKEYRCVVLQRGWFRINIRQPDETNMRDSVLVL